MKIRLLLSASLLLIFTANSLAQDNNCDVRQLQVGTYNFLLTNLDSIKKYTPNKDLTAYLELTEKGAVKKIGYYTSFGKKEQKEVKVWKGLETFVNESFSHCPESHFYNGVDQVVEAVLSLPLLKADIEKAKKQVEAGENYIAAGKGQTDVARDSKFIVDVKSFTVGEKILEPVKKEGTMDAFRSKMVKLSDNFSIAFDVVKIPGSKTNYLQYKVYERVDNKSRTITSEGWRPIVNGKVNLSVKGIRDTHEGVKHIKVGEEFDFTINITLKK
jgi:hypothetical protein